MTKNKENFNCIYKLTIQGKSYIGSTCNLNSRLKRHYFRANCSTDPKSHSKLYKHFRECKVKRDYSNCIVEILEIVLLNNLPNNNNKLLEREDYYLRTYKPELNTVLFSIYRTEDKQKYIDKIKTKYTCECGSVLQLRKKDAHEKTRKHSLFIHTEKFKNCLVYI